MSFLGFSFVVFWNVKNKIFGEGEFTFDTSEPAIAVVKIGGVIMNSQNIVEKLLAAEKQENVKAIIVRIDTPGGAVGPVQEIYEEIIRIDKKVPVVASMGSIAASGGYYIAAAARKIYANAGTLTGSIGVIMQFVNLSKLYEFLKISPTTIKAGKYKDLGNSFRDLTSGERKLMKNMISEVHERFKKDIKRRRGDKLKNSLDEYAQGQIFSGEWAAKEGLVDELGSLWKAGRDIHEELQLPGELNLVYMKTQKEFSVLEFVENIEHSFSQANAPLNLAFLFKYVPLLMYSAAH